MAHHYVYGLGLIGQEQAGEYLSYHFDFRGSTVALTDETAQVTERFQYSPYGVLLSDSSKTPFLFRNGHEITFEVLVFLQPLSGLANHLQI
jgi:hypothetical protein